MRRNLRVGNVVLIADKNYPRGAWLLAPVVEVVTGRDGLVRSAKVKTTSTVGTRSRRKRKEETSVSTVILTRPIAKLCLLEMDEGDTEEDTLSVYTEENSQTNVVIKKNR